jgi:hypothetical protein
MPCRREAGARDRVVVSWEYFAKKILNALAASCARTSYAIAISAGGVVAPAAHIAFGAIHKDPQTVGVRADFQVTVRLLDERFREGASHFRQVRSPSNLSGL